MRVSRGQKKQLCKQLGQIIALQADKVNEYIRGGGGDGVRQWYKVGGTREVINRSSYLAGWLVV